MGGPAMAGNLASPGLRIVGGLIDAVILFVAYLIVAGLMNVAHVVYFGWLLSVIISVGYLGYMWSTQGASVGMLPFGFKVRDVATGQYPTMGKAMLRAFIWVIEFIFTFCLIGALGWLWQLWDPQRQAIHDKAVDTIVTTS
jgi:uncharacterized RDD family membrane protein YckC